MASAMTPGAPATFGSSADPVDSALASLGEAFGTEPGQGTPSEALPVYPLVHDSAQISAAHQQQPRVVGPMAGAGEAEGPRLIQVKSAADTSFDPSASLGRDDTGPGAIPWIRGDQPGAGPPAAAALTSDTAPGVAPEGADSGAWVSANTAMPAAQQSQAVAAATSATALPSGGGPAAADDSWLEGTVNSEFLEAALSGSGVGDAGPAPKPAVGWGGTSMAPAAAQPSVGWGASSPTAPAAQAAQAARAQAPAWDQARGAMKDGVLAGVTQEISLGDDSTLDPLSFAAAAFASAPGGGAATGQTLPGSPAQMGPLQQAMCLLSAEFWDSEAEGHCLRNEVDIDSLVTAWPTVDDEFESRVGMEVQRTSSELDAQEEAEIANLDYKVDGLRQRLGTKARDLQGRFHPEEAEKLRSKESELMDAADQARERKTRAKRTKLACLRRKLKDKKEAVRRALGPRHHETAAATFIPDAEALTDLTASDAVRMVSDASWSVLQAVEVVALRPARSAHAGENHQAWQGGGKAEVKLSARQDARLLHESCETVAASLTAAIDALASKLAKEDEETPAPDKAIEAIAKGEEGLTKEQKRDKAMFEGQQEFDMERKLTKRVEDQVKRAQLHSSAAIEKVERVLRRRWQRRYKRYRPETLRSLAALSRAVAEAEDALDAAWHKQQEKAAIEAGELDVQRRAVHAQTRLLLSAATIIREEKARMAKAYQAATAAQKQKLMKKALKRVRRLNNEIKAMEVIPDLKQNHSVLLYALRMLEARLNGECPNVEVQPEEGTLEEFMGEAGKLEEVDREFEEKLETEISALQAQHDKRAARKVAQLAQEIGRSIMAEHGTAVPQAREAIGLTLQAATMADFATAAVKPFAVLAAQILPEVARYTEVESSPGDASTLRPRHKTFHAAVKTTLGTLEKMRALFSEHPPPVTVRWHDEEWEGALRDAEQQWRAYCDAHPVEDAGPETPRDEDDRPLSPDSPAKDSVGDAPEGLARQELRDALLLDDMDLPPPVANAGPPAGNKSKPPKPGVPNKPGVPKTPSAKAAPLANATSGPPSAAGKASAKKKGAAGKMEEMKAVLGKLDQQMDNLDSAMKKTGQLAKPSKPGARPSSAVPNRPPPNSTGSRK